jgi:hypothetical protein
MQIDQLTAADAIGQIIRSYAPHPGNGPRTTRTDSANRHVHPAFLCPLGRLCAKLARPTLGFLCLGITPKGAEHCGTVVPGVGISRVHR